MNLYSLFQYRLHMLSIKYRGQILIEGDDEIFPQGLMEFGPVLPRCVFQQMHFFKAQV